MAASLLWFAALAAARAASPSAGVRPISTADAVVAVYQYDRGQMRAIEPRLILVAWPDGQVVLSENAEHGGPPYRKGTIPPARVHALLARLEREGWFKEASLGRSCVGPEGDTTTLLVRKGRLQLHMESWHERAEAGGRLVSRSCGLTALDGRARLDLVRQEKAEDLYYRLAWAELRGFILALAPVESRPATGQMAAEAGVLSWRDTREK